MSDNITAARPYARAVFEKAQQDSSQQAWSEALQLLVEVVANEAMNVVLVMRPSPSNYRDNTLVTSSIQDWG